MNRIKFGTEDVVVTYFVLVLFFCMQFVTNPSLADDANGHTPGLVIKPLEIIFDTWIPYGSSGSRYSAKDVLVLKDFTVAIPGCEPVRISYIGQKPSDIFIQTNYMRSDYLLLRLVDAPKCQQSTQPFLANSVLAISITTRFNHDDEKLKKATLQVDIFGPTDLDSIVGQAIDGVVTMEKEKELLEHQRIAQWSFYRKNYDICSEGSRFGALVCMERQKINVLEELDHAVNDKLKWIGDIRRRSTDAYASKSTEDLIRDFKSAQDSWEHFQDAECDFEANIAQNKTGFEKMQCNFELATDRIKKLKKSENK